MNKLTITDYWGKNADQSKPAKCIVVQGETKPLKDLLKSIGGKHNRYISPDAWVFPKKHEQKVREVLARYL